MNLPLGFAYSAVYAGIRQAEKDDLGLIVSGLPANAAAVFTQNRVQAAPVKLSRRNLRLSKGLVGAVLVNAGNANCATRTGDAVAAATSARPRQSAQVHRRAGAARLHRRHRRGDSTARKITDALPALIAGLSRRPVSGCRRRHPDHRPGAQDRLRRGQTAARRQCASRA